MDRVWKAFDTLRAELEARYSSFTALVETKLDKHHSENRTRLQNIDAQSIANGVKLDRLYGSEGQPGAVDRLTEKVSALGDKIAWAAGGISVVVVVVGWYLSWHK